MFPNIVSYTVLSTEPFLGFASSKKSRQCLRGLSETAAAGGVRENAARSPQKNGREPRLFYDLHCRRHCNRYTWNLPSPPHAAIISGPRVLKKKKKKPKLVPEYEWGERTRRHYVSSAYACGGHCVCSGCVFSVLHARKKKTHPPRTFMYIIILCAFETAAKHPNDRSRCWPPRTHTRLIVLRFFKERSRRVCATRKCSENVLQRSKPYETNENGPSR